MKKTLTRQSLLAFAILASTALPIRAQGLEFSGGVNFAQLSGSAVQDAARNVGMNFGLDLVIPVGPLGLNLGAGWSQKGVENTVANSTSIIDLTYIVDKCRVELVCFIEFFFIDLLLTSPCGVSIVGVPDS